MSDRGYDIGALYEASGGDPSRCEVCDDPLDDARAWTRGLDGAGAHHDCLRGIGVRGTLRDSRSAEARDA